MALQLTAAGTPVNVAIESISYERKVDDPATCTFDIPDTVGYSLTQNQIIQVTDTVTSAILYSGFIDSIAEVAYPGNAGIRTRSVTCKDNRWRVEKRVWTGQEFDGWTAGDALAKMHQAVLASEGIGAAYALRHDFDSTTFGQGTLSGTVATNNTLTLSASGTDFTKTEAVTADFATGTLTNVTAAGNALGLTSSLALKFSGSVAANLANNNFYCWRKVWAGTPYTLVSGDEFHFDVWITSSSPEIKASIELLFSDGSYIYSNTTDWQDQYAIELNEKTNLKGWADDQWMHRVSPAFGSGIGKTVVAAYLVFDGDTGGDYTAYFKNIKITNSGGGITRVSIFSGADTKMKANVPSSTSGYYNVKAQVTTVYEHDGARVSPSRDLSSVGIVKGSVISWVDTIPAQASGGASQNYPSPLVIESSIDGGASWDVCTNHAPIPSLLVGMNTSGRGLLLRETLAVGGPSPEMAPQLTNCSFTVYSAAAATKSDFVDIRGTQALLNTGVLTNATSYADGIKTTGQYRDWNDGSIASQSVFGTGNINQTVVQNQYSLRNDGSGNEIKGQFVFAGQWQNFVMECDVFLASDVGSSEFGLLYRTTSWTNTNNTYGYFAHITSAAIKLNRASNGGAASFTTITTVPLTLTIGNTYRMKVVVTGSTHQVFLNDYMFINTTDATYTATGYVGVRMWNAAATRTSTFFDNFGIVGYEADLISVSSWTTPALALSGTLLNSCLNWNASVPSSSDLVVESTLNNGTLWETCTNGGQIPQLVNGYNASGKSLKIRYSMTNQAVNVPIALLGHSVFVIGQYSASGTRVSPALAIDAAGTIGSSSVTWQANQPAGTGVAVATSPDNITYTGIAASGNPVAGLVQQGPMVADDFDVNSAANYTATFWAGGVAPVFSIDTAHSRMQVISGTNALLVWTTFGTAQDAYAELITDSSDAAGLVVRYIDINNLYYVTYRDGSASTNPNTVAIRKRVTSTDTQLVAPVTLPAAFTRGTYHTLKVTMIGSVLTCYFDGVQAAQVTDASLTAAGYVGIRQNSAVTSNWYSIRAQQLGASATGKNAYSKVTLTSTNPAVKPIVSELVMSVRGPDLMTGALLPSTQYAYKKISDNIKDAASKSKYSWRVDENLKLILRDRAYTPAPWPLYSFDPALKGPISMPKLTRQSPLYCNRQYVTGAIDLQAFPEGKVGDGTTQSWTLAYPVDSITSITLDGNPQTVGIQGVDTGRAFYYQPGQNTLSSDSTLFPEQDAQIAITYVGQVPYTSMRQNTAQQTALALIDSTTGIVEASEDCGGLPAAAADAIAQARIDERAILSMDWEYTTERGGLAPGQLQTIFVPEYGIVDTDVLITDIKTNLWADTNGTLNYRHDVSTTSGPNLGSWERIFALAAA